MSASQQAGAVHHGTGTTAIVIVHRFVIKTQTERSDRDIQAVTGREEIDCSSLLHLDDSHYNTRGHQYKLKVQRSRLDVRKSFFSNRVVTEWNGLSAHIVEADTVTTFKNRLDKCSTWGNQSFSFYACQQLVTSNK